MRPLFGSEEDDLAMAHGPYVCCVQGRQAVKDVRGAACLRRPGGPVIEKDRAAMAHGPHMAFVQGRYVAQGIRGAACLCRPGTTVIEKDRVGR